MASSQYDILLCSETLASDVSHVLGFLVHGVSSRPWLVALLCARSGCLEPEGWLHMCETDQHYFATQIWVWFLWNAVFRVCGAIQNFHVFSLYSNLDLENDRIFDCLLTSRLYAGWGCACLTFLFVDDLTGHHQQWLGSTTTNTAVLTHFHQQVNCLCLGVFAE